MKRMAITGSFFALGLTALASSAASSAWASSPEFKVTHICRFEGPLGGHYERKESNTECGGLTAGRAGEWELFGLRLVSTSAGTSVLVSATTSISCAASTAVGEITGADTLGKLIVIYTGCLATTSTGCTTKIKSLTGKTGEIVTNAIKGLLGTVKTSEATSGVGLLFEPETGEHRFVTFAATGAPCNIPEATVNGNLAGEVTPVNKLQSTDKIVLTGTGAKQKIKEIVVLGKIVTPEFEAFGSETSETATDELVDEGEVAFEVT